MEYGVCAGHMVNDELTRIGLLQLRSIHPLKMTVSKPSSGGVCLLNEVAHITWPIKHKAIFPFDLGPGFIDVFDWGLLQHL